MNTHNHIHQKITGMNLFDALSEDLKIQTSYGLEYIIDEIFQDKKNPNNNKQTIDWFGFSDLTI